MSGDLSCSIFVQLPRPQKLKNSLRRFFCYKNYNTIKEENLTFSEKNYNEKKYFMTKICFAYLVPSPLSTLER
ncbi:hypothetical protein BLM37_04305 [Candidatus Gracilibacteria bacterium GN02-873]|nr:hypothetical protein BLM37_04305 [Candidatus Gracilibacteria bacterium GN02-873]